MTKDTITVSIVGIGSGPLATLVSQMMEGMYAWQDDVNANGGIYGRKVVFKMIDHKETAEGAVAACKAVQTNGSFTSFVTSGEGAQTTFLQCVDQARWINLYYGSAVAFSKDWRHSYAQLASYEDLGSALAHFVKNKMKDAAKPLGVIYVNKQIYKFATDSYVSTAKQLGMRVVGIEPVDDGQQSFIPQLTRLKNAGAENVAMFMIPESIGVLRDARALNYQPNFTGGVFAIDTMANGGRDLFKGLRAIRYVATTESPLYRQYVEKAHRYNRNKINLSDSFWFYGYGLFLGKALELAGPNPTQESLARGLETLRNWDNQVTPPISFEPGRFNGTKMFYPAICCNDKWEWKGIGPPSTTFDEGGQALGPAPNRSAPSGSHPATALAVAALVAPRLPVTRAVRRVRAGAARRARR